MSSLRDVAHLAGVSLSTVSRVINSSAFVKPQTARRVEEAIKKLNYKPNLMASGLKSKSSRLIGVVIPTLSLPTFVSLIQNVSSTAINLITKSYLANITTIRRKN